VLHCFVNTKFISQQTTWLATTVTDSHCFILINMSCYAWGSKIMYFMSTNTYSSYEQTAEYRTKGTIWCMSCRLSKHNFL